MFFKEIGLLLKNKREEMNITQEDVAYKLKIPLRSIIAIEDGAFEELPHEVYVRTFTKGYANFLKFPAEEIQAMFSNIEDFSTQIEAPKNLEVKKSETQPDAHKSKSTRFMVQLLLVALLGASAYFYYAQNGRSETFNLTSLLSLVKSDEPSEIINQVTKDDKEQIINTDQKILDSTLAPEVNQVIKTEDLNDVSLKKDIPQDIKNDSNNVASLKTDDLDLIEVDTPSINIDFFNENENDFETFIANTPEAFVIDWNSLSDVKAGEQQAVVYVTADCWMRAIVDGKSSHFTVRKGNQKELLFKKTLQLQLGNASAVTLFHNQKLVKVGDSSTLRTINLKAQ